MSRDAKQVRRSLLQNTPTPAELTDAPELAILHALNEILDLALRALIAAHPQLGNPDTPFWARETSRATGHANDILATAHRLRHHIRAYRTAITLARHHSLAGDPDIPF